QIARRQRAHPLRQRRHPGHAQPRLDLGQGAQRQAQRPLRPRQPRDHLAPHAVRHHSASKRISPALAKLSAKLASPSCSPAYSNAATRNGPSRTPKSGTISRHVFAACSKKASRIRASDAASRKIPCPDTAADFTPAPASSSRHRPALSLSVASAVLAFSEIVLALSPATVMKAPAAPSIFSRMSLPRCAVIFPRFVFQSPDALSPPLRGGGAEPQAGPGGEGQAIPTPRPDRPAPPPGRYRDHPPHEGEGEAPR